MPTKRTISSNVSTSLLGSHGSPSAGMQYVQRKLHLSVTEMRRSSAIRPNVSTSGPDCGVGRSIGCSDAMDGSSTGSRIGLPAAKVIPAGGRSQIESHFVSGGGYYRLAWKLLVTA